MEPFFESIRDGGYDLIVFDALYRFLDGDENDNATRTLVYNRIDQLADETGAAIIAVHHATKGSQADKALSDVGAGAGSQSRAADVHSVLRPHEEEGVFVFVFDATARSIPPIDPVCIRWEDMLWREVPDLDPERLEGRREPAYARGQAPRIRTPEDLVSLVLEGQRPMRREAIYFAAKENGGIGEGKAKTLLSVALEPTEDRGPLVWKKRRDGPEGGREPMLFSDTLFPEEAPSDV